MEVVVFLEQQRTQRRIVKCRLARRSRVIDQFQQRLLSLLIICRHFQLCAVLQTFILILSHTPYQSRLFSVYCYESVKELM